MSFTKVAPAGIGTEPGNSILIGDSLLHSTGIDIGSNTGIGVTIRKHGDATFTGIITASAFFGDGSGLEGVSSSGIGTALSDDDTSSLNKIYYANQELSIGSTVTVNHPDTGIAAYTHYQDLVVKDNADFIVADGDTFIPDVLGINTSSLPNPVSSATGGRIRAGTLTNAGANGAPNFPNGLTGTAGTFTGNLNVGGVLTYEDVTNVDSVGVVTARAGINLVGNDLNVGSNIKIGNASGIITATSFRGDASQMTGTGVGTESSINTSGIITATSFSLADNTAPVNRNIWINSECLVNQRANETFSSSNISGYPDINAGGVDLTFYGLSGAGTWTIGRAADGPVGYSYCHSFTCTSPVGSLGGGGGFRWWQRFEGQNLQRFCKGTSNAKKMAVSFYVKSNITGQFVVEFLDYDTSGRNYDATYTIDQANVWEYKRILIDGDTTGAFANDNQMSLAVEFWMAAGSDLAAGTPNQWKVYNSGGATQRASGQTARVGANANDYFKVTGIQFEVGANTPHERETYATELRDVYRYYYVHAAGSNKSIGQATVYQDNNLFCQIQFPVTMRTAPGLRTVSGSSFYLAYSNGGNDGFNQFSSLWNAQITGTGMNAYSNDGVSGRTAGHSAMIITNHANAMLGFSAEL